MVTTIDRCTKGDEIYRSTDGGASWVAVGPKAVRDAAGARYLYWGKDKPSAVGWMGDIDIDPFNADHVFYGTGQGIWQSTDATGASSDKPTHWVFQNRGLEETVAADLVSPPSGPPLLSGVFDICGFRHDHLDQPPSRACSRTRSSVTRRPSISPSSSPSSRHLRGWHDHHLGGSRGGGGVLPRSRRALDQDRWLAQTSEDSRLGPDTAQGRRGSRESQEVLRLRRDGRPRLCERRRRRAFRPDRQRAAAAA